MGERLIVFYYFLSGGIMVASLIAALYFFRFWNKSHDRFFLFFSIAFVVFGAERLALTLSGDPNSESTSILYLMRLFAFVLILWAIFDKNLRKSA